MAGVSTTQDIFYASVIHYLYGEASLLKIENTGYGRLVIFTMDVPEEDNNILRAQFADDTLTLQAWSFAKSYRAITAILKQMRARELSVWEAPEQRDDAFYERGRKALREKQEKRR